MLARPRVFPNGMMSTAQRLAFGAAAAALGAVVIYASLRRRRQRLAAVKLEVDGRIRGVEQPAFVAATCEGLLVSEMRTDQVRLVTFTGSSVRSIGQEGWGKEPLSGPRGLVSDGEHCWIVELANNRVQKFRLADGLFCGAVGTRGSGHERAPHHHSGSNTPVPSQPQRVFAPFPRPQSSSGRWPRPSAATLSS